MKAMKPGTGRHITEALKALYAPPTPESKAEAEALAREHCARVEAGVLLQQSETASDLLSGSAETSGRCLRSPTTPAGEARCFSVADVEGAGDVATDRATPPGDSPTDPRLPRKEAERASGAATERVGVAAPFETPGGPFGSFRGHPTHAGAMAPDGLVDSESRSY